MLKPLKAEPRIRETGLSPASSLLAGRPHNKTFFSQKQMSWRWLLCLSGSERLLVSSTMLTVTIKKQTISGLPTNQRMSVHVDQVPQWRAGRLGMSRGQGGLSPTPAAAQRCPAHRPSSCLLTSPSLLYALTLPKAPEPHSYQGCQASYWQRNARLTSKDVVIKYPVG